MFFVGGWGSPSEHAAFLRSPQALEVVKEIGPFIDMKTVMHVQVDASEAVSEILGGASLRVEVFEIGGDELGGWEEKQVKGDKGSEVGGWDVSHAAQAGDSKEAFERMREQVGGIEGVETTVNKGSGRRRWVRFASEKNGRAEDGALGQSSSKSTIGKAIVLRSLTLRLFLDSQE